MAIVATTALHHEAAIPEGSPNSMDVGLANDRALHLRRLLTGLINAREAEDYRSSTAVTYFQIAMQDMGIGSVTVNGEYDAATQAAVTEFQTTVGGIDVDGDLGGETLKKMIEAIAQNVPGGVPPAPADSVGGISQRLFQFYNDSSNYDRVDSEVMGWFGTHSNACAAFLSTALRDVGLPVPHTNGPNGFNISLMAQTLAEWLIARGWTRHSDSTQIRNGDIIVTKDAPGFPGFAAHIFMFAGWSDQAADMCFAVDNQGFRYPRNLGPGLKTPMSYYLRSPR